VASTEYEQMINLNNDGEMTIFETEAEQNRKLMEMRK